MKKMLILLLIITSGTSNSYGYWTFEDMRRWYKKCSYFFYSEKAKEELQKDCEYYDKMLHHQEQKTSQRLKELGDRSWHPRKTCKNGGKVCLGLGGIYLIGGFGYEFLKQSEEVSQKLPYPVPLLITGGLIYAGYRTGKYTYKKGKKAVRAMRYRSYLEQKQDDIRGLKIILNDVQQLPGIRQRHEQDS